MLSPRLAIHLIAAAIIIILVKSERHSAEQVAGRWIVTGCEPSGKDLLAYVGFPLGS